MKIKKNWISYICIVLLVLNAFFKFEILIDLSNAEKEHIFPIYLYEIIAIITFVSLIINYRKKCVKNRLANKLFVILCIFSAYYIILFLIRVLTENNHSSSMMLFRLNFSMFTFVIYLILNVSQKQIIEKAIRILILALNIGYLCMSLKEHYMAPHFPDVAPVYFTILLISLPCYYNIFRRDIGSIALFLSDVVNFIIMSIYGCFSGSRAVFLIWVIEFLVLILLGFHKKMKLYISIAGGTIVILGLLYMVNFNYCQGSIVRELNFMSYLMNTEENNLENVERNPDTEDGDININENIPNNTIENNITGNVYEHNNKSKDKVKEEIIVQDVNYHNPISDSNRIREGLFIQAMELLEDDWLLSLKGRTELIYWQGEVQAICGAHNVILDYTLAFGLVGDLIIFMFYFTLFLSTVKRLSKNREQLIIYVLMLLAMLGMGMTQSIFSVRLSLILFGTYMALFYINGEKENRNETGIIKKRNHIHS